MKCLLAIFLYHPSGVLCHKGSIWLAQTPVVWLSDFANMDAFKGRLNNTLFRGKAIAQKGSFPPLLCLSVHMYHTPILNCTVAPCRLFLHEKKKKLFISTFERFEAYTTSKGSYFYSFPVTWSRKHLCMWLYSSSSGFFSLLKHRKTHNDWGW